jgi:glycosyltransferase involved in cell wall biosynthesis
MAAIAQQYRIGIWHWELDRLPADALQQFDMLHEIWTISHYVRDTIARDATIPVLYMPPAFQRPEVPSNPRQFMKLPENCYIFLFSFDPLSTVGRKNPFAVIEAFRRAFGVSCQNVLLVMKTHHLNLEDNRKAATALREAMQRVGGLLIEDYLERSQMNALLAACDCYVSLHRSEGLGFGMVEAMLLGKPVIATAYSGNLDYMTDANSYGVRCTVRPVQASDHHYQPDMVRLYPPDLDYRWAEPDIDHAAALMFEVFNNPNEARLRGQRAAHDIASQFSLQATSRRIRKRLEEIAHG